jgi:hypothetical protein
LATFNANTGEFRTARGLFVPSNQMARLHGARHQAYDDSRPLYVGLLVVPIDGVDKAAFLRRAEVLIGPMLGQADHTFLSQEGNWRQHTPRGVQNGDAVRLVMPHLTDRNDDDFAIDVAAIAHTLGAEFHIKELWLEFQRSGVSASVFQVTP